MQQHNKLQKKQTILPLFLGFGLLLSLFESFSSTRTIFLGQRAGKCLIFLEVLLWGSSPDVFDSLELLVCQHIKPIVHVDILIQIFVNVTDK